MAIVKVDLLFRQQTNQSQTTDKISRTAGWSEGWYRSDADGQIVARTMELCEARARMLTPSAEIIGQRYRIVGGGSSTSGRRFKGSQNILADMPMVALLLSVESKTSQNTRRWMARGVPDARIVEGEYSVSQAMTDAINDYASVLDVRGFLFAARELDAIAANVISVDANGNIHTATPHGFVVSNRLRFLRVRRDASDRAISGTWYVETVTDSFHFKVGGWTAGPAHGGRVRFDAGDYFAVDGSSLTVVRATTHKVGADFFRYRGRRSKTS